jgi:hypothetical protein
MNRKSLVNQLELAYAPMTAYEFATMKDDPHVEIALEKASLYAIGQRAVITFENVVADELEYALDFEIHQKGNANILKGKLPLVQSAVGSSEEDIIGVALNYLDKKDKQTGPILNNIHCFSLIQVIDGNNKFLIWFSPEKLLQNWWNGDIDCDIQGDVRTFTNYNVHYVGKATKQSILKRLTGHSTFQDILSLEAPVTEMQIPANEIVVLCFEFYNNLQIQSFGAESDDVDEMIAAVQGRDYPEQEKVFLDAEKALIKAMKPHYNKELFNNYPISKDGLYADNYDAISYTFMDPITLVYREGEVLGGLSPLGGDAIAIFKNSEFKLIKHE